MKLLIGIIKFYIIYIYIVLKAYTSHNLMDMDKGIPPNLYKPELIVDFSNDPLGEMKIILNYIFINNINFA